MPGRMSIVSQAKSDSKDMGVTRQSANTYVQELHRQKFITIKRRGQGKTNLYELNLTEAKRGRHTDVKNFDI
jgi:hypothetical protein